MKPKRYRQPKQIPNTIKLQWGKLPHDSPDIVCAWGNGCHKSDANYLLHAITGDRMTSDFSGSTPRWKPEKSVLKELEIRGYDITTLKFSIQKKTP